MATPRARIPRTVVFLLCTFVTATALAREAKWVDLETDSFRALSLVSERKSRAILRQLQVFQAALSQMTNLAQAPPRVPTVIFLLNEASFRQASAGMGDVAGVFVGQPFRNDILIDASRDTQLSLFSVYHEYVHFQSRNQGHLSLPAFYEEGLAQFVQYFRLSKGKYEYGFFPGGMRSYARSSTMPLERVVSVEVGSDEYRDHKFQAPFYARSLLLLHYCQIGNRTYHEPLLRFVVRMANGQPDKEAFEKEFGKSMAEFDQELDAYLPKAERTYATMRAESIPEPRAPGVREISREDGNVQFAWLLLRTKTSLDGIDAFLKPKLEVSPDDGPALGALALWHERQDRSQDATGLIERLTASPTVAASDLTGAGFIFLGRSQVAGPERTQEERAAMVQQSRRLFERALGLSVGNPEASYGYAVTQMLSPDDVEKSLLILTMAVQGFPESG